MLFLSYSRSKSSFVSVVFDFNASLNDVNPFSLMALPVWLKVTRKNGLFMYVICVLLFFVCVHNPDQFV